MIIIATSHYNIISYVQWSPYNMDTLDTVNKAEWRHFTLSTGICYQENYTVEARWRTGEFVHTTTAEDHSLGRQSMITRTSSLLLLSLLLFPLGTHLPTDRSALHQCLLRFKVRVAFHHHYQHLFVPVTVRFNPPLINPRNRSPRYRGTFAHGFSVRKVRVRIPTVDLKTMKGSLCLS